MSRAWPPLSDWQIKVLRWIAEGCPGGVMTDFTYKTTAVALQNRRLVTMSKRGGVWRAEIVDAGRHYLTHGTFPSQPAVRSQRVPAGVSNGLSTKNTATSTSSTSRRATPAPPAVEAGIQSSVVAKATVSAIPAAKSKGPAHDLVAAVLAAGGRLVVHRSRTGRSDYDYNQLITVAQRYGKVPPGQRLTSKVLPWPDMEIRLEEGIPGTDVSLLAVPVPEHVSRYHPVVIAFRAEPRCHEVSKQLLPRALRLLHALVTEAERRGHAVSNVFVRRNSYGHTGWSPSRDGHIAVAIQGHLCSLRLRELPAADTSSQKHPTTADGNLTMEICGSYAREGRPFRWADRKSWRLEDKLPDVLREVEIRAAEDEHRRVQTEHAATERRRQWELAMAQAKESLVEAGRAEHLRRQADRWREARQLRAYLAAMSETIEAMTDNDERQAAGAWLTWAESHVATLDPLTRRLAIPKPPEATPDALTPFLRGWSPYGPDNSYGRW